MNKEVTVRKGLDERTLKLRELGRKLEEWYEDYCSTIVHYPPERQLNALRNMRKQILESGSWTIGGRRMGDNPGDVKYLTFSTPKENIIPRLKGFGNPSSEVPEGEEPAWEDDTPVVKGMPLAEFGYLYLSSAVNYEIDRLKKLIAYDEPDGDNGADNGGNTAHFSKRVTDEELKEVYNGLIEMKMLPDNPSLEDFIYWHTGAGKRPAEPLKWETKNVCRYYVAQYLDSDWATAEKCFSCKRGKISNLSQATNITSDNRKKIDEILKKARQSRPPESTTKRLPND